jgi:uncharacterized protein (TIGR04222 family)
MNPFDWTGGPFLVFYLFLGAVALVLLFVRRRDREGGTPPSLQDPYLIAYLRGGVNEVVRVATISLVEARILDVKNDNELVLAGDPHRIADPIQRALAEWYRGAGKASQVFRSLPPAVQAAEPHWRAQLEQMDLLAGPDRRQQRASEAWIAGLALGAVAALKIFIALSWGHHNILFLIMLFAAFAAVLAVSTRSRHTAKGKRLVRDLQSMFSGLQQPRGSHSVSPMEVAMLAAVFGVPAMAGLGYDYTRKLYPQATSSASGCGSYSGCGSSDSSGGGGDGGSSCGSGCGGCGGGGD